MRKCTKISTIIGICVIVGICIGIIHSRIGNDLQKQRFEIFQSYSFASGEHRDTIIKVIINVDEYDTENMFDEIKIFHNKLNGKPDKLEICLYNSKNDIKSGNCIGTKTYYKD